MVFLIFKMYKGIGGGKMKNKYILLMGSSIIIVGLLLFNRQLQFIIPVSADVEIHNSNFPISVNMDAMNTTADKKKSKSASADTSKSRHATVPMDALNSIKDLPSSKLFTYLSDAGNREKVSKRVLQINNGRYTNGCVYFIAEALRQIGISMPTATCNTAQLLDQLKSKGWTCFNDYKQLQPGDICFTTDGRGGNNDPTHTYVFMAWASQDNYDYAMICDNQQKSYGDAYHKRNITKTEVYKGEKKEIFRFFMRK